MHSDTKCSLPFHFAFFAEDFSNLFLFEIIKLNRGKKTNLKSFH